jgi:penicillin G amidase
LRAQEIGANSFQLRVIIIPPSKNMVYANADGNIGFIAPGRIPIRKREKMLQGMSPAPGWDAHYDWQGFIPYEQLPQSYNSASGVIVTANQKVVATNYSYLITNEWALPHRSDRIENLVGLRARHNTESFRSIQGDVTSLAGCDLLPLLLAVPAGSVETSAILRKLSSWNGEMSSDRAEPLVVAAWIRELTRLIYSDELGPEFSRKPGINVPSSFAMSCWAGMDRADGATTFLRRSAKPVPA